MHVCKPGIGHVRLCADDIGAVLQSVHSLPVLGSIFHRVQKALALFLNIPKCVVVPLTAGPSLALFDVIKGWLARLAPGWIQFRVQGGAEYL
eukprot:9120780-Karenia_brevis.AAC.1